MNAVTPDEKFTEEVVEQAMGPSASELNPELPPLNRFDRVVIPLQRTLGVAPYDARWEVLQRSYQNRSIAAYLREASWSGILAMGFAAFFSDFGGQTWLLHIALAVQTCAMAFGFVTISNFSSCIVRHSNPRVATYACFITLVASAFSWAIFCYAAIVYLPETWHGLAVGYAVAVIAIGGTGCSAYPIVALSFMTTAASGAMLGVIHAEKSTPVIYFCSFCLLVLLLYLQFIRRSGDALKHVRDAAELETSEVEKRQAIEAQHQAERALIGAREEERTRDEKRRAAKDKRRKEELLALSAQFETSVGKVSKSVAKAAKQFQITASTMSKQAEAAAQQIELIADGMGQVAAGSTAAAAASDEFTISIESVNAQAAEAADLARLTNQSAQATDETVSALTASAQQIGEIAQLIDSIAGRTRLLALNASIEAARGGKAGRGFAVVASEVKDLATKTSKATSDVAERIAKMQDGSQASAQELNAISSQIGQLEEAAIAIASAMDQQAVASKSLAQSIDMAASGAGEVSATTQDLRKAAKAVGVASHDLLVASDDIERQTALLNEEVAGFLAHIRSE